jgi:hypothetical protein
MKKILVSIATTLVTATVLVACNGSGTNSNDVTSEDIPLSKAVCTSSKNWKEVGIGMSAGQVEERLGKPASIVTTTTSAQYQYERCRSGNFLVKEAVDATTSTPGKPAEYQTFYFGGQVVISSSRGVTSVTTPVLDSDKPLGCEWDMFNYPFNYGEPGRVCRTAANPY